MQTAASTDAIAQRTAVRRVDNRCQTGFAALKTPSRARRDVSRHAIFRRAAFTRYCFAHAHDARGAPMRAAQLARRLLALSCADRR
jgi:hypothetical protein